MELLSKHHNVLALVTTPTPSPARNVAMRLDIRILDPTNPNSDDFIDTISSLRPDMIVLAAYGFILKKKLLGVPRLTSINLHPSLLPAYRGAAPIQWAIINGEKHTGVTTFVMDPKVDHGGILLQKQVEILDSETYGELQSRLAKSGAALLHETISRFKELKPVTQHDDAVTYTSKISKDMRQIEWNKPANEIVRLVLALSPSPGAFTAFRQKQLGILRASVSELNGEPGKIVEANKDLLIVGAGEQSVRLEILKPEAKREQETRAFINGYRPQVGERMG
jgi:methionyl-tRNA formyltransferase